MLSNPRGELRMTSGGIDPHHCNNKVELAEKLVKLRDLLLSFSTRSIGMLPRNINKEIDEQFRIVAELLGFDQIVLCDVGDKESRSKILARYPLSGAEDLAASLILSSSGEKTFSHDATRKSRLMHNGALSFVVQERGYGRVQLYFHSPAITVWPEDLVEQLGLFSDIVSSLLTFKEAADFHLLLSEVSATYINLPVDEIEEALRRDFIRLSKSLHVEICSLHMYDEISGRLFSPLLPFVWHFDEYYEESKPFAEWLEWLKLNPRVDPRSYETAQSMISKGESMSWNRIEDIPDEWGQDKEVISKIGLKSSLAVPIRFNGAVVGCISIGTFHGCRTWPEELKWRLQLFGEVVVNAVMRKRTEEKLRSALTEVKELKDRLEADYTYLKEESDVIQKSFAGIVGKSNALKRLAAIITQVGPTNTSVLILGETGCGKGLLARAVHAASTRKDRPFMQVNCAAFTANLIESELFGHEKGAFTGAFARRQGRFEAAKGTTLFLDEIGDLPLELQPKLLRLLEEGEFERVGGTSTIKTDVRIIAATNMDLEKEVEAGRFRRDLWYRLNVFPLLIPPLRERPDDIPLLISYFANQYQKDLGKKIKPAPQKVISSLQTYSWPGNVRELRNIVERAVIMTPANGVLQLEVPITDAEMRESPLPEPASLAEEVKSFEKQKLIRALNASNWIIDGPKGAAQRLGIKPTTLRRHIRALGIIKSP